MLENRKIKVGISVGDTNGVGVELILKTFEDKRLMELCTPIVYASEKLLSFYKKALKMPIQTHSIDSYDKIMEDRLNVFKVWADEVEVNMGVPTLVSGKKAHESFEAATNALVNGDIDVLLTGPISKENIQSENFNYRGHTDYLAEKLKGDALMILMSDQLKVGLVTDHIPVAEVSKTLTKELICKKIDIMYETLKKDFGINAPKIAVLGLNPHCGDHGVIGSEDDELLRPILNEYQADSKLVFGPYAADGFFGNQTYLKFDAVISMYHDQGLVGFKAVSFGKGVNFTAGLDRVRVSPDHGTAYDIVGKGVADHTSFKEALYTGISVFQKREEYKELTKNVLKH